MPYRRKVLKSGAGALGFGLAGCLGVGGGGDDGNANEIRMGYVHPVTGPAARLTAAINPAVQLAVREVNEGGGIDLGDRTVELTPIEGDGACEPEQGRSATQRVINQRNADILLGPNCSGSTRGSLSVIAEADIPVITSAASPEIDQLIKKEEYGDLANRFWFIQASSNKRSEAMVFYHATKASKVALLGVNNEFGRSTLDSYEQAYKDMNSEYDDVNIKVVKRSHYPHGAENVQSTLNDIKNAGPDIVHLVPEGPGETVAVLEQAQSTGLLDQAEMTGAPELAQDVIKENIRDRSILVGLKFVATWLGKYSDEKSVQSFLKKMAKSGYENPFFPAAYFYDEVKVIAAAYEEAGSKNLENFRNAMRTIKYGPGAYGAHTYEWKEGQSRPLNWGIRIAQWNDDGTQSVVIENAEQYFKENRG